MSYFNQIGIKDSQTGDQAWVTEFHVLRSAPLTKLTGAKFSGTTIDTNYWATTTTGSGSISQSGGQIVLTTGATANSTTQLQSVRVARFVPGAENIWRGIIKVGDTGSANNKRQWGCYDANNGYFYQLSGTTLNIVARAGGSDTVTAKSSWNVNTSFTLDTNFHVYEIAYTVVQIKFYIDDILVHEIDHVKTPFNTLPTQSLNLFITQENFNSGGGTANVTLTAAISFISRVGFLETEGKYFHGTTAATTVLKYTAGRLHRIILNDPSGTLITIYDNTAGSGTVIAVINGGKTNGVATLEYSLPFNTGLTVVSTGTWDFTVVWE